MRGSPLSVRNSTTSLPNTCRALVWPGSRSLPSATTNQPSGTGNGKRGSPGRWVRTIGRWERSVSASGWRGMGKPAKVSNSVSDMAAPVEPVPARCRNHL